jgi:hypothetical protein
MIQLVINFGLMFIRVLKDKMIIEEIMCNGRGDKTLVEKCQIELKIKYPDSQIIYHLVANHLIMERKDFFFNGICRYALLPYLIHAIELNDKVQALVFLDHIDNTLMLN